MLCPYLNFSHIITLMLSFLFQCWSPDITIGFTQETYTFNEGEAGASVTLAKDSGIISERNDIAVTISLQSGSSATQGSDFSVTLLNTRIGFDPSDQSISVPLSIIEDALPEGVESFTLSVASADFGFGATRRDTFEETEIFIIDNDGAFIELCVTLLHSLTHLLTHSPPPSLPHSLPPSLPPSLTPSLTDVVVGFERIRYNVAESVGTFQICVIVLSSLGTQQPLFSSFTLVANTLSASAGVCIHMCSTYKHANYQSDRRHFIKGWHK